MSACCWLKLKVGNEVKLTEADLVACNASFAELEKKRL